ncbi:hypothetical protein TVAG_288460 [Trichomonas vaginalis G3]|uniref:Uncharacterized protein n=1 Tax=Trichomonas vaginalis (strain ATCC PRA-98 / G3) TaxID=412133 RepID=A2FEA6_TRIV3|nr:hypothetical protein TVAGG3_0545860 [Trichomonas vaginalis G3]EAX96746.1 hypothetical protein TVAG_288460 [Trichomonas vaginalis G3]KAI5520173.1 hypothetical protein TVAGG3_0545860 [Trichomonas vaginalis G3]|eukprot:XP_001309676.1 hypothetical protein [Trichomonas vaginalis G3]
MEAAIQQAYDEIEKFVLQPDFWVKINSSDQDILDKLREPAYLMALIDFISVEDHYHSAKKFGKFFQSADASFTEIFATNLQVANHAIESIKKCKNYSMALGVIGQIFSRCICSLPEAISDLFRVSSTVIPTIVEMIQYENIYNIVYDEVSMSQYKGIPHFFWNLIRILVGKDKMENLESYIPEYFKLFREPEFPLPTLSTVQRNNLIAILKLFCQNSMHNGLIPFEVGLNCHTLCGFLTQYIITEMNQDLLAALPLIDLAYTLVESKEIEMVVLSHVVKMVKEQKIDLLPIKYLSKYNSFIPLNEIIPLFQYISVTNIPNIPLNLMLKLFKAIAQNCNDPAFATQVYDIIKQQWDDSSRLKKIFYITVIASFNTAIGEPIFNKKLIAELVIPFTSVEKTPNLPNWTITAADL